MEESTRLFLSGGYDGGVTFDDIWLLNPQSGKNGEGKDSSKKGNLFVISNTSEKLYNNTIIKNDPVTHVGVLSVTV